MRLNLLKLLNHRFPSQKSWRTAGLAVRSRIAGLKIAQKIRYSIILILGMMTLGVSLSLALAEWQQRRALVALHYASENSYILHELGMASLELRSHPQRLLEGLGSQVSTQYELSKFASDVAETLEVIRTLETFTQASTAAQDDLQIYDLIEDYRQAILDYQATIATLWSETDPKSVTSSTLETTREAIFERMTGGELVRRGYTFERLAERLRRLDQQADASQIAAEADFATAQAVRLVILAVSLMLSLITAIAISGATSRAIAQPLEAVTQTAQRVTEENNFTLRVPVRSTDEVGVLSQSLNGLIERVCDLLNEQSKRAIELEHATQAAEAANHAKSEFLASMNHELRTPLNGILGYTQILANDRDALSPKQQQGLDIIHRCGEHLLTLISDVLDLAKIEARKMDLFPQDFHFKSFLEITADICRIKAQQKGIAFRFEYDDTLPKAVYADDKRLRQVLLNLLSNAVKFTDEGCVTFRVDRRPIAPGDDTEASHGVPVRFTVRDTGIGLSPDGQSRIFQPFEQVAGRDRNAEGTGLGLSIGRQLVEVMGGSIQLESQLGEGSCFWFDLHLPPVETWLETTTPRSAKITGHQGTLRKVLIVDDHENNRQVVIDMLEPLGFQVFGAIDGQDGFERAIELHPDVILTDVAMPNMDGLSMVRALRKMAHFKNTPIFAIPATLSKVNRDESFAAGCDIFLPKPLDLNALLSELEQQLNLVWVYDPQSESQEQEIEPRSTPTIATTPSATAEDWVIPSAVELRPIYHEARGGFVNEIQKLAAALKETNPDYAAFADRIIDLTRTFQIEALLALLAPHI